MPSALVIDDKWVTASSHIKILSLFGITGQHANTARNAVLMIREKKPDVILLDVHMPGVDGFEFIKYIHQLPGYQDLPIFVVTSDDQPETADLMRSLGAQEVLIKPLEIDELENALRKAKLIK
ncbi:MAG: response regulator [Anaerolineales bacterium]|nr:response regulator [Anaerolineales bacterium]